jgi:arylsulfatase A-like enzyme
VANFDINDERDFFPAKVFSAAADWINDNVDQDKWLLVVDCFDVHEPFHCPEPYASMYTDEDPRDPDLVVWPVYGRASTKGVVSSRIGNLPSCGPSLPAK